MRLEKQTLTGDIVVDENAFIGCKLKNARLVYSGGPFEFSGETMLEGATTALVGAAANTVEFLRMLRRMSPKHFEEIMAGSDSAEAAAKPKQQKAAKRKR